MYLFEGVRFGARTLVKSPAFMNSQRTDRAVVSDGALGKRLYLA